MKTDESNEEFKNNEMDMINELKDACYKIKNLIDRELKKDDMDDEEENKNEDNELKKPSEIEFVIYVKSIMGTEDRHEIVFKKSLN